MKKTMFSVLLMAFLGLPVRTFAQGTLVTQTIDNPDNEPREVFPVPSARQMDWQETEFYAFFHYGMNTFTNLEWGNGGEAETIYAPTTIPNCLQWIQSVKAAGMKGGIAVVKHHDGFCLWPTASTTHSILKSGGVGPQVNIPKLFSEASEAEGMKYGFYISPWDRNSAYYAQPEYVKNVFLKQATELAAYGNNQFEMWFDGANGGDGYYGGAGGTRTIDASTYYDMPNLSDSIHKLQPNCVMWGMGGEARWIGNESGYAENTNWSNESENGFFWNAGESDAKATSSGWFWHSGETPLTAERLYQMYLETVGRNATLILNTPPNQQGVLPTATVNALTSLGTLLKSRLNTDLAPQATVAVSEVRTAGTNRSYVAANLTDNNKTSYWATNDETKQATITLNWNAPILAHYVMLQEFIRKGQRIKGFKIETSADGTTWTQRASSICTTVGYKRIIPLDGNTTAYGTGFSVKAIRVTITDTKACPLLHTISVF